MPVRGLRESLLVAVVVCSPDGCDEFCWNFYLQTENIIQGWPERTELLPTPIRHPSQNVGWLMARRRIIEEHIWAGLARNILTADKVCRTPVRKLTWPVSQSESGAGLLLAIGKGDGGGGELHRGPLPKHKVSSSQGVFPLFTQAPKGQAHAMAHAPPRLLHRNCRTTALLLSLLEHKEVDGRVSEPVCDGSGSGPMNWLASDSTSRLTTCPATRIHKDTMCVARQTSSLLKSRCSVLETSQSSLSAAAAFLPPLLGSIFT